MKRLWILAFLVVLSANVCRADTLLYTGYDLTQVLSYSPSPPASFVWTWGACSAPCYPNTLDPIAFLPSNSSQSVDITTGTNFSEVADAVGSGSFDFEEWQTLSFSGSVPPGWPNNPTQPTGEGGGDYYTGYPGATVTSIVVTIAPFSFQHPAVNPTRWQAEGDTGQPSPMTIQIYAAEPLPPYVPPPGVPEPSTFTDLTALATSLGVLGFVRAAWSKQGSADLLLKVRGFSC